jgi:hypothetical protein
MLANADLRGFFLRLTHKSDFWWKVSNLASAQPPSPTFLGKQCYRNPDSLGLLARQGASGPSIGSRKPT